MSDLKINPDSVINVATQINKINHDINDEFESSEKAVNDMNRYWDGPASERALQKFSVIKRLCCEDRFKVLDQYQLFMQQAVGSGYKQTESHNTSLADQFK